MRMHLAEPPVEFPKKLSDFIKCEELDLVVLECEVSRANAVVTWFKDDVVLESTKGLVNFSFNFIYISLFVILVYFCEYL